ncbi:DNA end-binding protein Ku [Variovorax sp. HW608]|uniref:non-homologous end joining protein Ku n=1 Tax=Variovorax sp. HW608 TaxID=1034889 RepID=UPI00081FB17D|nr:Ku protein [Variovorax sp. HW608]SCK61424.1 DNA end-binding protein Ku [Variovorax sp. HW608]
MPKSKPPAPRVLWKGAISFGLVHIPVALYAATVNHGIDFDWLDKRTMDPVGYKRVNKKTGREVAREQIVKGVEYERGQYVVLSKDEIEAAYPKTTQTVSIERFVPADSIPFIYLDRPYYLAPINRGGKVYALLRDTLKRVGRIGIARVVIQTKEHLAVLVPTGPGLVLNLLRWGADIRPWKDLPLPAESPKQAGVTERELKMAEQLVKDMSGDWDPADFEDSFTGKIHRLIEQKVEAGQTEEVTQPEAAEQVEGRRGGNVVDLTELLQRSLRKNRGKSGADEAGSADDADAGSAPAKKARKAPARKAARRHVSAKTAPKAA